MCFSSPSPPPVTQSSIAAAPPPPALPAEQQQLGQARQDENKANFGNSDGPNLRVDRSTASATSGPSNTYSM